MQIDEKTIKNSYIVQQKVDQNPICKIFSYLDKLYFTAGKEIPPLPQNSLSPIEDPVLLRSVIW